MNNNTFGRNLIFFFFFFVGAALHAQCPTISEPTQYFCNADSPTVADLSASDNGNGVTWYASEVSTSPLSLSNPLVNNQIYYADDNTGTCGIRESVQAVIYSQPTGQSFQGVCVDNPSEATLEDLIVIGNNIQWYPSATGGSPLPSTTILTSNTIYYASQTEPNTGCETSRFAVFVTVSVVSAPTGNPNQVFCNDPSNPPTVADLEATNATYWYATENSPTPLSPSTLLIEGENYFAANVQPPCESTERFETVVSFEIPPYSGENSTIEFCETELGTTTPFNLYDELNGLPADQDGLWSGPSSTTNGYLGTVDISNLSIGDYEFTYTTTGTFCPEDTATVTVSITEAPDAGVNGTADFCNEDAPQDLFGFLNGTPDAGGNWSPALSSGSGMFDPSVDTAGTYTYIVNGTGACPDATATVIVTVTDAPDAGESGSADFCDNEAAQDLFGFLNGSPDAGGTWTPTLSSGSGMFDPSVDAAGTYTYTVNGTGVCPDATATVIVTITEAPDAGENGTAEFCNEDAPQDLFDFLNGTPDAGGNWSPALSSGSGMFDPSVDAAGTYTYIVNGTGACPDATATVTVTITEAPDAGEIGTLDVCVTDAPQDLFSSLNGSPDAGGTWTPTLSSGSGMFDPSIDAAGDYTYTVTGTGSCPNDTATVTVTVSEVPDAGTNGTAEFCSSGTSEDLFSYLGGTPIAGGAWSPALTSGSGMFDPSVDAAGTYTYTLPAAGGCPGDSSEVIVTITEAPNAGENGTADICSSSSAQDLFGFLNGTPETGGTWSPTLTNGNGMFDPSVDTAGTYIYTVTGSGSCPDSTAMVTVTITEAPDAGENGTADFCTADAAQDLFGFLNGTPETGGTWSPALTSGYGMFDPSLDAEGLYTYTVTGSGTCSDASATVLVSVTATPNAGDNGTLNICANGSPENLFEYLNGTPDNGGSWSPALSNGTGIFDPSLDAAGVYTYTVNGVGSCTDASATVTVSIEQPLSAGNTTGPISVCVSDGPVNLSTGLDGSQDVGGVWIDEDGVTVNETINISTFSSGSYTFAYVIGGGVCAVDQEEVTVNITENPNAGNGPTSTLYACTSDGAINLLDYFTGNPDTNGTWSPALASGTNIFDPSIDTDGTYTYTVMATGPCTGQDIATVTVAVTSTAVPTAQDQSFCAVENQTVADLSVTGDNVLWYSDASLSTILPGTEILSTGTYYATQTDATTGCESEAVAIEVTVNNTPAPTINIIEQLCPYNNPTIADLTAGIQEEGVVIWYNAAQGGEVLAETQVLENNTTYYASITGSNNCESASRLAVTINYAGCDVVNIPDGFSPNGDGQNDLFVIENLSVQYPNFEIKIYNRYGNLVFEGNANNPAWDGTSNQSSMFGNGILPPGVYFYVLKFNDAGMQPIQGSLYLNR